MPKRKMSKRNKVIAAVTTAVTTIAAVWFGQDTAVVIMKVLLGFFE